MGKPDTRGQESYTGLRQLEEGLPATFYFDPQQHARELDAIWYRNWVYLGRADSVPEKSYRVFEIGSQSIVVTHDDGGNFAAFHNTCRHRGSALCTESAGELKGRFLSCPYHRWTYNLQGRLVGVPAMELPAGFNKADYPLYRVALTNWGGFLFANLAGDAAEPLEPTLRPRADWLEHWPLAELKVGHRYRKVLACNWKIFWENFNECYHCPGIHPELSSLVPIYGRSIMGRYDDPQWQEHAEDLDPKFQGGLRPGAETWSMDGQAAGVTFAGLTPEEREAGQRYVVSLPSAFIVGHVDYVRIVSMRPLGPEQTELTAEWLFPQATLDDPGFDMSNVVDFATLVLEQDGWACELNQRGLQAIAHKQGVLLPQEYAVFAFQQWVRRGLGLPAVDAPLD